MKKLRIYSEFLLEEYDERNFVVDGSVILKPILEFKVVYEEDVISTELEQNIK
jgi:hypothetical protein